MKEKVTGYGGCFRISTSLKEKGINLHPIEIAEAYDISVPPNEVDSAPITSLTSLHCILSRIQESEDLEEISDLMACDFWRNPINEQGEKRMVEIVSTILQSKQCSLDELLEMNQHTYIGSKARKILDEAIYKECLRLYDPEAEWSEKLFLLKNLRSGSEGKKVFVDLLLENGKADLSHNEMRQLLIHVYQTSETDLYQKVARFIVKNF